MLKYAIWGTGKIADRRFQEYKKAFSEVQIDIVAFIDNDNKKWGDLFHGIEIVSPSSILKMEFDYIDIWVFNVDDIKCQIIEYMNIPPEKIRSLFCEFKYRIIDKYKDSEDIEVREYLDIMKRQNSLEVFSYKPDKIEEKRECFWDKDFNAYYTFFEKKKMYFPNLENLFTKENGKVYVNNLWQEQDINSPHLYEENEVFVHDGDVIVDAGVCEGNFALHNIDKAKKIYLIECDSNWMEALKITFEPYREKVVFCDKFLSGYDSESTIKIDSLVKETINFIKMDIEGEEVNALIGAKETITKSNDIRCSICSYHKHNDEEKIKNILSEYGMNVHTSKGYMFFLYDDSIWKNPELRRGIVRGSKIKHEN